VTTYEVEWLNAFVFLLSEALSRRGRWEPRLCWNSWT